MLLKIENTKREDVITAQTAAVGVARAGSDNPILKADFIEALTKFDFGQPPHSLIFLGDLHFMEIDSLIAFADAPAEFRRLAK
jgi:diphthamide biosynthesis methyltransferase